MFFIALVKSEIKIENNVNYVKKVLQNVHKYPQNNVIELIYNFTNAFCEIWCFKNVRFSRQKVRFYVNYNVKKVLQNCLGIYN